jgi:alkanesulfonate monooxygenase SsuD/methylene tetrahydromethanopterin reductase-like flavin-dependent oxidoreductase (luciferase family)
VTDAKLGRLCWNRNTDWPAPREAAVRADRLGAPEEVAEMLASYLGIGYRHLIVGHPAPYDEESAVRLAKEVRPSLESGG